MSETGLEIAGADQDRVLPFILGRSGLRGRLVRLGPAFTRAVARQDYAAPVAQLVGETMATAAALASLMKYDGVFTLQTRGDGPLGTLVADVTAQGDVRAYAKIAPERLEEAGAGAGLRPLVGEGYLAFTVDQGPETERYQGIVELAGDTLAEAVRHYFRQSEQLETGIVTAASAAPGAERAAAILVQPIPKEGGHELMVSASDGDADAWRRAMVLMASVTPEELTDPDISLEDLLWRLFHDEEVRVLPEQRLAFRCRCSAERVERVLVSLSDEEIDEVRADEGGAVVTCEFCGTRYAFSDEELAALRAGAGAS